MPSAGESPINELHDIRKFLLANGRKPTCSSPSPVLINQSMSPPSVEMTQVMPRSNMEAISALVESSGFTKEDVGLGKERAPDAASENDFSIDDDDKLNVVRTTVELPSQGLLSTTPELKGESEDRLELDDANYLLSKGTWALSVVSFLFPSSPTANTPPALHSSRSMSTTPVAFAAAQSSTDSGSVPTVVRYLKKSSSPSNTPIKSDSSALVRSVIAEGKLSSSAKESSPMEWMSVSTSSTDSSSTFSSSSQWPLVRSSDASKDPSAQTVAYGMDYNEYFEPQDSVETLFVPRPCVSPQLEVHKRRSTPSVVIEAPLNIGEVEDAEGNDVWLSMAYLLSQYTNSELEMDSQQVQVPPVCTSAKSRNIVSSSSLLCSASKEIVISMPHHFGAATNQQEPPNCNPCESTSSEASQQQKGEASPQPLCKDEVKSTTPQARVKVSAPTPTIEPSTSFTYGMLTGLYNDEAIEIEIPVRQQEPPQLLLPTPPALPHSCDGSPCRPARSTTPSATTATTATAAPTAATTDSPSRALLQAASTTRGTITPSPFEKSELLPNPPTVPSSMRSSFQSWTNAVFQNEFLSPVIKGVTSDDCPEVREKRSLSSIAAVPQAEVGGPLNLADITDFEFQLRFLSNLSTVEEPKSTGPIVTPTKRESESSCASSLREAAMLAFPPVPLVEPDYVGRPRCGSAPKMSSLKRSAESGAAETPKALDPPRPHTSPRLQLPPQQALSWDGSSVDSTTSSFTVTGQKRRKTVKWFDGVQSSASQKGSIRRWKLDSPPPVVEKPTNQAWAAWSSTAAAQGTPASPLLRKPSIQFPQPPRPAPMPRPIVAKRNTSFLQHLANSVVDDGNQNNGHVSATAIVDSAPMARLLNQVASFKNDSGTVIAHPPTDALQSPDGSPLGDPRYRRNSSKSFQKYKRRSSFVLSSKEGGRSASQSSISFLERVESDAQLLPSLTSPNGRRARKQNGASSSNSIIFIGEEC